MRSSNQYEAFKHIIESFCKEYKCVYADVYVPKQEATVFRVLDPERKQQITLVLKDKDTHDIGYMIRTKESIYDTLVKRYNER